MGAAALVVSLALVGCAGDEKGASEPSSGTVAVEPERGEIATRFGAGDRLFARDGAGRRLRGPLSDRLLGTLAPLLVPEPAGGPLVAYQSWRDDGPSLRLHDLRDGRDRVLADRALSIAWRAGTIAYVRVVEGEGEVPERSFGHVVVRSGLRGPEARWTTSPGSYVVAAWAGRRLLAYRLREGWPDLLVLDGPGRARVLARASALVAVSPDGGRAFLAEYGASPPLVRVVDVPSGDEVARASLPDLRWVSESGSWASDRVAATTSEGIAVLEVREGTVELEQTLRFPPEEFQLAGLEPRLDEAAEKVTARASLVPRPQQAVGSAVLVECDRATLRCTRSARFPESPGPRVVYNPSRP